MASSMHFAQGSNEAHRRCSVNLRRMDAIVYLVKHAVYRKRQQMTAKGKKRADLKMQ